MSIIPADQQFIEYLLQAILDHPEDIVVTRVLDELGVLITVKVNEADMGTLIGKNGQTAKSLRTLLRVIGSKNKARVNLKILDGRDQISFQSDQHDSDSELFADLENLKV